MNQDKRFSIDEMRIVIKGGSKWNRRINCVPQTAKLKTCFFHFREKTPRFYNDIKERNG